MSASSQGLSGIFGPTAETLELFLISVISRQEIDTLTFFGDYEKCFFLRQAMIFYLKTYMLILLHYQTVVWNFQLRAK